ncbi:MAG: DUF1559 domain-containing protein [Planctomycetota bacterium]
MEIPGGQIVGGFSSYHPGGSQFALASGAVRFISENINPNVYTLLGSRADREIVDEF